MPRTLLGALSTLVITSALTACMNAGQETSVAPSASSGQVTAPAATPTISYFAAARLAEQATFGANPTVVADIRGKGMERWIDDQLALPATRLNLEHTAGFPELTSAEQYAQYQLMFLNAAVGAADQLRMRVAWALSQVVVVSDRKTELYGVAYWKDFMVQKSLGLYGDLLVETTIHPAMGNFLDNSQNRPKSTSCPNCAPNENYARELMQLFTIGVVKLNPDGTLMRDSQGRQQETYTQRDVEELARALTGWEFNPLPANRPGRDWGNWTRPMTAATWNGARDSGSKQVMGRTFPAGQSAAQELRAVVDFLIAHPNTAPFMATRLIQHLVKSNPSPAYVQRVAAVFQNNGRGVAGDLKAVVRAILLDAEARAGDVPGNGRTDDGKLREPFLSHSALWRGLGCARWPSRGTHVPLPTLQRPFSAESVFNFYAPTDRAPGSNLLAPEQRILNANEFTQRLGMVGALLWDHEAQRQNLDAYNAAGCDMQGLVNAYTESPSSFIDYLAQRFFRGTMPPTLRATLEQQIRKPIWDTNNPFEGPTLLLAFSMTSPYFGAMR